MSDLTSFARKMMRIKQTAVRISTPTAIFGTIGDLPQAISHRPALRIGMWPCLSQENPQLAMGLWLTLAHLLERWNDIEVYRLFAKFEGDSFDWTMEASQFDVEDFDVEALDENIGLWGKLEKSGDTWTLTATLDNDNLTGEDNEAQDLSISGSAGDLINKLPEFAALIADNIGAVNADDADLPYPTESIMESPKLTELMEKLLRWEVKLTSTLWGIEWEDEEFEADFDDLLAAGAAEGSEFAAWTVAKAIAESMRPGYSVLGELLVERMNNVAANFPKSSVAMAIVGAALFQMGHAPRAYRLLKAETSAKPNNTIAWLKSAEILAMGGHLSESIEQFQSAIEKDAVNSHLYRAYGNVLLAADQYGHSVDSFLLINLAEHDEDYLLWEAIAAYGEALARDPKDIRALYTRLLQMVYVQEEDKEFWDSFSKLLALDTKGEYIRDVIESLYELEDVQTGIDELQNLLKQHPERIDLYINLGSLYLTRDEADSAKPLLEKAQSLTKDPNELAEIERLLLAANDDDFERRFGEAVSILDAGNELPADEVEFLEKVVEQAPHLVDGQLALARAYYFWDDKPAAMEVLLDSQEALPDQAPVLVLLSRLLWESGEKETAFQYLNRGLAAYPYNVALLSRIAQYLFENGQYAESRTYLVRAEEISPRDPFLQEVRSFIARKIAENPNIAVNAREEGEED
jgi:tetratricopeptide (TPR) repeat protein